MNTEQIRERMGADATTAEARVMEQLLAGRQPAEVSDTEWSKMIAEAVAIEWVYSQDESCDDIDTRALEAAFAALYGRAADQQDHDHGLWSLCCAATPNCGTRPAN